MAKSFNTLLTEISSKASPYARSPADNTFLGIHAAKTTLDANGNGDDVFCADNVSKDNSRPLDAEGRRDWVKMKRFLKIAAGATDVDGDHDGDVLPGKPVSDEELEEEELSALDHVRRQYHQTIGDFLKHDAYKAREAGNHKDADKLYDKSQEAYKKAKECAFIKERKESIEEAHDLFGELLEETDWARFKKGDHVHMQHRESEYSRHSRIMKHGVVADHDAKHATVHWEDGSKSKHHQNSGSFVGKRPAGHDRGDYEVRHNEVWSGGERRRLTNDEHKQHLADAADRQQKEREHAQNHEALKSRLASIHHSELKPHHLKAIHDVLDRASRGED